ncbi:MAG: Asp-tRNA(Asn)/Glu-tRNA(Gln) amidotransferase subunit GatB [Armatimonadetes bacterium]|nr:Asp-tRNA(Asn)/Glu-tRNA(Gln) amidotransferase subunit GatB [Armatimonadota bacterium]
MAGETAVQFEIVIGLEIHVQLMTQSKMFCGCSTKFGAPPNTQTCPVCLGLPGSLPVINRRAVELGLRTALALECRAQPRSQYHRKNYYYPDLPKNYQISQYQYRDHPPLGTGGRLIIPVDGMERVVGIRRVHLEEDTGKLVHEALEDESGYVSGYALVDYNRGGVPLMEVVTDPDLRSPEEARIFLGRLRTLLQYIEVSTGRMEEGTFRCDANVSLRRPGEPLGIRTEVKNMNSLRSVERALAFEVERQRRVLADGGQVIQETRHWDEQRGVTFSSREKEEAQDYRYFPEPDLVPLAVDEDWIADVRRRLPELPEARRERFITAHGLSAYDAEVLTSEKVLADFFEATVAHHPKPKAVSNWLLTEILGWLNAQGKEIQDLAVTPAQVAALLRLVDDGTLSIRSAKEVGEEMLSTGKDPSRIVEERGLVQISDEAMLRGVIQEVIGEHPGPAADFRGGKDRALTFLVGQVMRKTRGRANPEMVNRLLRESLRDQG